MSLSEGTKGIKARISGLKRRRQFVPWRDSRRLAGELEELLIDIESENPDCCVGAELVASFYETDTAILGHCDDSSGYVGDVYREDARGLFLCYAAECEDKSWLANLVHELNLDDQFGVRDSLIHCAAEYLPEPEIRSMILRLQELSDSESDQSDRRHWYHQIESLAQQIKDAPLFEKTRRASWGTTSTASRIDIAEAYFESGDPQTALSWLQRISEEEAFQENERDELYLKVFGQMGDHEGQSEVAWQIFRRSRSARTLDQLVAVQGEDRRDEVVEGEVLEILRDQALSYVDAAFLTEIARFDAVGTYLVDRADKLDGDYYDRLLPIAEVMEATAHPLAASVVYRALLESILKKARSKIYHYAVRYLKKLDLLAGTVPDWGQIDDHKTYFDQMQAKHKRKTSFWSKYGKARPF